MGLQSPKAHQNRMFLTLADLAPCPLPEIRLAGVRSPLVASAAPLAALLAAPQIHQAQGSLRSASPPHPQSRRSAGRLAATYP
jgi:hypothetical protein